ncbi:MAG: ABC transporter permease [Acidimicrobiales bacterium]
MDTLIDDAGIRQDASTRGDGALPRETDGTEATAGRLRRTYRNFRGRNSGSGSMKSGIGQSGIAGSHGRLYRRVVLSAVALYFIVPLAASARFSFEGKHNSFSLSGYTSAFSSHQFWSSLALSAEVGLGAVVLELIFTLSTSLWVNLRAPRWRSFADTITLLPIVVPVVVLVLGVSGTLHFLPSFIVFTPVILVLEYVVLAMPYAYRIVDSGVRSLDLRTMVDAGRSVGGNWLRITSHILLPNLKGSMLGAAFMTFGLVLGEYVMASLLSFNTFPVWLETVGVVRATEAVALSVIALAGMTVVLGVVAVIASSGRSTSGNYAAEIDDISL